MNDYANRVFEAIKSFDAKFVGFVENSLKPYGIPPNPPFFTTYLVLAIKVVFYFSILLIPLSIIKLFFIGNTKFTVMLIAIIITIGLAVATIFLGFFQLLYSL